MEPLCSHRVWACESTPPQHLHRHAPMHTTRSLHPSTKHSTPHHATPYATPYSSAHRRVHSRSCTHNTPSAKAIHVLLFQSRKSEACQRSPCVSARFQHTSSNQHYLCDGRSTITLQCQASPYPLADTTRPDHCHPHHLAVCWWNCDGGGGDGGGGDGGGGRMLCLEQGRLNRVPECRNRRLLDPGG
jgi:hypothetical protein